MMDYGDVDANNVRNTWDGNSTHTFRHGACQFFSFSVRRELTRIDEKLTRNDEK